MTITAGTTIPAGTTISDEPIPLIDVNLMVKIKSNVKDDNYYMDLFLDPSSGIYYSRRQPIYLDQGSLCTIKYPFINEGIVLDPSDIFDKYRHTFRGNFY